MLAAGINVCLGTDSLASNPSLSILEEVRFLREMDPEFPADELISLATMHGATALGFGESIGSLEPGKAADLVVLPLPASGAAGRWTSVLESPLRPVAVFIGGRKVVG
jgi:cytosine/adenosine deaminase-related metal-dependent hydrolase